MTSLLLDAPRDTAPSFAEPGEALGAADTMKALFRAPIDPIANPQPYADLIRASERSTRFTGNIASESSAREEAYDIRNKAIKAATGIDLENPERDGYQREARAEIRRQMREGAREGVDPNIQGGIYALQRRMYDAAAAAATERFPDVQFGPIDDDAKKVAQESIQRFQEARKAPGLNPFVAPIDVFGGSLLGSRRDPIFLGSLLAGPASSTSRYALGRIASGAVRMGFYNAGISALEQPAVQEWRAKIGLEHGITPALEDVGQAFLFGAIPGAVIHGGVEAVRAVRMRRVLAGQPEPGDVADALLALKTVTERDAAALRAGEDSALADKATMTIPRPKDVPPELHDDMAAAALKRADQPDAPSPEAARVVRQMEGHDLVEGELVPPEVSDRVTAAAPRTAAEAARVADEAFDDLGRRHGAANLRESMARGDAERAVPPPALVVARRMEDGSVKYGEPGQVHTDLMTRREVNAEGPTPPEIEGAMGFAKPGGEFMTRKEALEFVRRNEPKRAAFALQQSQHGLEAATYIEATQPTRPRGDVLDKVPFIDDSGAPKMLTSRATAALGERENTLSMLVKSCK